MSRIFRCALGVALLAFAGCHGSGYAVRPVPRIAADSVGKPVSRLEDAFGQPRKIETTATQEIYVWFFAETPAGAPVGFHGCEMEDTVDAHSAHVLGYSLSNIGWSKCGDVQRKIRVAER
jgi:hypothetical protein